MRVAVASDHAGFPLKDTVIEAVRAAGHTAIDLGNAHANAPVRVADGNR